MFSIFPIEGGVCAANGFFADGISAGLKPNCEVDVAFIYSTSMCEVECLFTKNNFYAAPIAHYKMQEEKLKDDFKTNFVLINSKNANALTGDVGIMNIESIMSNLSKRFTEIKNPLMSSTGVIGVQLPVEKICESLSKINLNSKNNDNAKHAIMTTDRYPKSIAFEVVLDDNRSFKIGAICKGAGMINPSLATMLCFITTDALVPKNNLKEILQKNAYMTFNAISVDGDTSTNDTIMLLSNGQSGIYDKEAFSFALYKIMEYLSLEVVKDGEGATRVVAFEVLEAHSDYEAMVCAKALSNSLLVKTALFGCDPNWGRIASTIGASGVKCDAKRLQIFFDKVCVYKDGEIYFDRDNEEKAAKVLQKDSYKITCKLGTGNGSFTAYGCDLGHEYVKINADYRS